MSDRKGAIESRTGKYRTLIFAVVVFILFDMGVLLMNFYIADQIGRETEVIDIAGRQRTLSQRITRAITEFELIAVRQYIHTIETLDEANDFLAEGQEADPLVGAILEDISSADFADLNDEEILTDEQIELDNLYINQLEALRGELQDQVAIFDWTLDAFLNGGKTVDAKNNTITLRPAPTKRARDLLRETETIWRVFKDQVDVLMVLPASEFLSQEQINSTLHDTAQYAREHNLQLFHLMDDLTKELTDNASGKATTLRLIQFGGIAGAMLFFLVIMYYIMLRFRAADRTLDQAKRETDEILQNVGGGLFLLGRDMTIASQHSAELTRIFNNNELGGKRFDRLLKELLPKETLETAIDFIELLLGDRVNEKLVAGLNPMDEVEVNFPDGRGSFNTKYLEFKFSRAVRNDKIEHLLVTVNDITERVRLAKELEESYEHREAQLELLLNILHINPQELLIFIDEAELSLNKINDILRESNTTTEDNRNKVSKIFRIAHALKGDASALELETFERMTHQFEDELDMIRKIRTPDGNDFIPLVVKLEDMLSHLQAIKEIALRLSDLGTAVSDSLKLKHKDAPYNEEDAQTDNWAFVEQLKQKVAVDESKDVIVEMNGINDINIPKHFHKLIRDSVIQFTRNAIVHGIETPGERIAVGKEQTGKIQVIFQQGEDGNYEFIFRDDGQGIDRERVKAIALQRGIINEQQAATLSPNQAYALIFHPGFSTTESTSENAGRGVGMDVVRTKVKEAGGKLRFRTTVGKYTEFRIILPAKEMEAA